MLRAVRGINSRVFINKKQSASDSGGNITLNLGLSIAEGDIAIVVYGWVSTTDDAPSIVTSGSTTIAELYSNDTVDTNFLAAYKIMGPTPDGNVQVAGHGANPTVAAVHVWRGVNTSTPMDVTATTATGVNTLTPNSPSITPVTPGAIIISLGVGAYSAGFISTINPPSGMSNGVDGFSWNGTIGAVVGIASFAWVSGAYDPSAWTSGGGGRSTDSWAAATIALRPA